MTSNSRIFLLILLGLCAGWPLVRDWLNGTAYASSARANNTQSSHELTNLNDRESVNPWGSSPFSSQVNLNIRAELASSRHKKMNELGYPTPIKYYEMDLKNLSYLAKRGDAYAMVQLAEQYYNEADFIKDDPSFEKNDTPKHIAMRYFESAVLSGYTHVASIISTNMVADRNLIDAYAWDLISKRFNDHTNDKIYAKYTPFANMSDMDKAIAQAKFDEFVQRSIDRGRQD